MSLSTSLWTAHRQYVNGRGSTVGSSFVVLDLSMAPRTQSYCTTPRQYVKPVRPGEPATSVHTEQRAPTPGAVSLRKLDEHTSCVAHGEGHIRNDTLLKVTTEHKHVHVLTNTTPLRDVSSHDRTFVRFQDVH